MGDENDSDRASLAELARAVDEVDIAEEQYRTTLEKVAQVDFERENVLAAVETARRVVRTLCDILIGRGQLNDGHRKLLERVGRHAARSSRVLRLRVLDDDKHAIAGPDIDCAKYLHLCRARCCTLTVELARGDLDDGIKWEIDEPYMLRHEADGWCHHIDRTTGGCTAYHVRPATCRQFDCRKDARIWVDFDAGIAAPLHESLDATRGPGADG
jgi:hypothetical protein